jgi:hypothetical protein
MSQEGKWGRGGKNFCKLTREVRKILKLRRAAAIQKFSTLILQMFASPDESRRFRGGGGGYIIMSSRERDNFSL